ATKMLLRQSVLGVNVVSHPVGLLSFPYRSNSIFHNAPRAVSILKRSPFLLKAKPFATSGWEPNMLAALRVVGVTIIVPGGRSRISRPTPPTLSASRFTVFDIGWMRNTSSQFTGGVAVQLAPGLVIFQTLPWPVVPSPVHRLPRRSNANPFVPGTPCAKIAAVGGFLALGLKK